MKQAEIVNLIGFVQNVRVGVLIKWTNYIQNPIMFKNDNDNIFL